MNYHIPKNSIIYGNFTKVHQDPKLWKDPEIFRPERFIDEKTGKCIKPEYLMPFGAGKLYIVNQNPANTEITPQGRSASYIYSTPTFSKCII